MLSVGHTGFCKFRLQILFRQKELFPCHILFLLFVAEGMVIQQQTTLA